ncbi:MAG TPA: zinc ribbon domain-containing protein [Nitrososphaeraceae archaeon]|jgi:putative FmdB family regulatory protein|nr:zinc ribbon domain-containing protein [Nitrososphaeraceae archaeon]
MPTYEHCCTNETCKHEWEDEYSIKQAPPKVCPLCQQETAQRLISGGSGKGKVELTGQDLIDKIKGDAKALQKDASKNEKLYANLLGEDRYQNLQSQMDRRGRR